MGEASVDARAAAGPVPFSVTLDEASGIVSVGGELDLATVDRFEAVVSQAEDRGEERLVLDLRDIVFLDSSGLRAILEAYKRGLPAGRRVAVVCGAGPARRVLEITGAGTVLDVLYEPPPPA